MAAVALTPRVRMMAICDRVGESKTEAGVFDLKGVRQAIIAHAFPFVPDQLWLFVLLSSPRAGEFPGYVRVVNDRNDRVVFHGHLQPRPRFDDSVSSWAICYPIRCRFPEAGMYGFQIAFNQKHGSDVLKGEIPLIVAAPENQT